MRLSYSSRFWLYAPIGAFALVAAAVMIHWWVAAGVFEKKISALKGREAVPGVILDWSDVAIGGFPFRMEATFTNFYAHGAGARGPFFWRSPKFALHALTYGRATTVYEAAGPQHLEWVAGDGKEHAVDFLPGTMRGSSVVGARGLSRVDIDIVDAAGTGFTAQRLQFHMRRDPDGRDLDLMVKADALTGFGAPIALVQAYVTLSQADTLAPLLQGTAYWPDAVRAWHGHGGEMKLDKSVEPDRAARALSALY
ncbi:MAG: hypothetical protein JWP16_2424 [Alphaproteobacteria bacterium]|jgi:hypothetical protein|nr:hypothetical protein [Alphaproteobacteria bacterium]MDB5741384.1 hypothetical protein [Alphaproteobacteria bacterium]